MSDVTGIVQIKIDGSRQRIEGVPSMIMGGTESDAVLGDRYHGEQDKPVAGQMTFTLVHMADTKLKDVQAWKGVTVEYLPDTGGSYVMTNAKVVNSLELNEGKVEVVMRGDPIDENK